MSYVLVNEQGLVLQQPGVFPQFSSDLTKARIFKEALSLTEMAAIASGVFQTSLPDVRAPQAQRARTKLAIGHLQAVIDELQGGLEDGSLDYEAAIAPLMLKLREQLAQEEKLLRHKDRHGWD